MKKDDEKLLKQVKKILETSEEKRNFLPLFNCKNIKVFTEKDRKNYLLNITKKYFFIKSKLNK